MSTSAGVGDGFTRLVTPPRPFPSDPGWVCCAILPFAWELLIPCCLSPRADARGRHCLHLPHHQLCHGIATGGYRPCPSKRIHALHRKATSLPQGHQIQRNPNRQRGLGGLDPIRSDWDGATPARRPERSRTTNEICTRSCFPAATRRASTTHTPSPSPHEAGTLLEVRVRAKGVGITSIVSEGRKGPEKEAWIQ